MFVRYQRRQSGDLSPARRRIARRDGSNAKRTRTSECPLDPGLSSFMLLCRDPLIESTRGRPKVGPLSSRSSRAAMTSSYVVESSPMSHSCTRPTSTAQRGVTLHPTSYTTQEVYRCGAESDRLVGMAGDARVEARYATPPVRDPSDRLWTSHLPIMPVDGRLGQERQRPTVRGAGCAEVPTIQREHSIDSEPIGEDQ